MTERKKDRKEERKKERKKEKRKKERKKERKKDERKKIHFLAPKCPISNSYKIQTISNLGVR